MLFFCAPLIARFYERPELVGLSRVVFLGFLLGGLGIASNAYLFKQLMAKERAKIDIIALLCSGIVGITLALNDFAYYGLATQTTVYIGVGSLLKLYFSPWKPSLQINFQPLQKMFGFGSKLLLTNIFMQINNNVMSVVLGKFYDAQQLGFYSQGQKWMTMGHLFIGGMINGVAQPILAKVVDDKERQIAVFRKMVRFGAFVSFPLMLGLAFVARELIVILIGEKWLPCVPFLQLFCLWGAVGYMWFLYTNILISHGKSDVYFKGVVLIGIFQIVVVLLLFHWGIYLMTLGYIISYYVSLLLWHYYVNRVVNIPLIYIIKDVVPYLFITLISFLIPYAIIILFDLVDVVNMFIKIVLSIILYITLLVFFKSALFSESILFLKKVWKK